MGRGYEDVLKVAINHFVPPGEAAGLHAARRWHSAMVRERGGEVVPIPLVETLTAHRFDLEALRSLGERVDPCTW